MSVTAELEISISNRSSNPIFAVSCNIATDRLNTGAGSYGERLKPCDLEDFQKNEPIEILPGQTRFFSFTHTQENLDSYDLGFALEKMGVDVEQILDAVSAGDCKASFRVGYSGGGFGQSCQIASPRTTHQAFSVLVQIGTGEIIRGPIWLGSRQPWPWGG